MLDLIIEGGEVIDGTGSPRVRTDIGISKGLVVQIGDLGDTQAQVRMNAAGRVVAPGFIDVHTHDDRLLLTNPEGAHPKLSQGVTTVITGNCGVSLAPLQSKSPPPPLDILGTDGWRYERFSDYLSALEQTGPAVNAACLVGHSTLRVKHVADLNRPASSKEAFAMAEDLFEALEAGAMGLSTGLYYPPAQAADAEEVIAVGAPLREMGGIITAHIRNESNKITEALREALYIGKQLGVSTVLSHHKLLGKANHGRSSQTLAMIEQASRYQPVCLDCYPYTASSTMLLPDRVSQCSDVLVTWSRARPEVAGRSLFALAKEQGVTPETMADALQPAGAIYFAMDEEDVSRILSHPMAMIGSDGLAHDVCPHPRLWGTFPRVLGHYVRERGLLSLEAAIHKMTGLSAQRFGLHGRGQLLVGHHADVVIFDEHDIADHATYKEPTKVSSGIVAVYVNGHLAYSHGQTIAEHAGHVLRRRSGVGMSVP